MDHLSECPLGDADLVDHPHGDADHGRQSQQPADKVAPPRVHVLVVVLQRGVFNEREGKGTLQGEKKQIVFN